MKKLLLLLAAVSAIFTACEKGSDAEDNGGASSASQIELSQQTFDVEFDAAAYSVSVTSPYSWEAVSKNDWIQVETTKGDAGQEELKFATTRNEGKQERKGTIVITSSDQGQTVELYVVQKTQWSYLIGTLVERDGVKGVIFYADNTITKILSVEEVKVQWSTEYIKTSATNKDDGAKNLSKIKKDIIDWESKYPVFKSCEDYGEGWYLPALNELLAIYNQKQIISSTLLENGYKGLDTIDYPYYCSSTEIDSANAYEVDFSRGRSYDYNKMVPIRARCIRTFQN